jgi:hypothetical protein
MRTGIIVFLCGLTLGVWAAPSESGQTLSIAPRSDSEAAGLDIQHPGLPGNVFDLRTCEAVLDGNRDFGLFRVKLGLPGSNRASSWSAHGGGFHYEWTYPEGIVVRCRATPGRNRVSLDYTLVNRTSKPLARAHLHTCVTTSGAEAFFPVLTPPGRSLFPPESRAKDYTELFTRLRVWSRGAPLRLDSTEYGRRQAHLSLMPANESRIEWAWWVNSTNTFDEPLIALASRDGHWTAGLWFERAAWASANAGDERACFHLFPAFGRIESGSSATVRGVFFFLNGDPEELRRRARDASIQPPP